MQDDKIVNSSTENPLKNENIDNVLKDLPKEKREVIYSAFYAIERSYSGLTMKMSLWLVTTVISVAVIFVLKKMPIGNNKKTS